MAFLQVGDYINDVRTLLQDRLQPFRYSTHSLVRALNTVLLEVRRIRPDLMIAYLDEVPSYHWDGSEDQTIEEDKTNPTWVQLVPLEQQFRQAIVHGITGHAFARDQEDIQDERATGFIMTFENMLTEVHATKGKMQPKV